MVPSNENICTAKPTQIVELGVQSQLTPLGSMHFKTYNGRPFWNRLKFVFDMLRTFLGVVPSGVNLPMNIDVFFVKLS